MPSSKFGSKFLGEERYQQYVNELTAEGTVGGEQLSPEERKEGFRFFGARDLLRSQTNSQIPRYLHFSDPFTKNFDKHIRIKFPLPLYYSRA